MKEIWIVDRATMTAEFVPEPFPGMIDELLDKPGPGRPSRVIEVVGVRDQQEYDGWRRPGEPAVGPGHVFRNVFELATHLNMKPYQVRSAMAYARLKGKGGHLPPPLRDKPGIPLPLGSTDLRGLVVATQEDLNRSAGV